VLIWALVVLGLVVVIGGIALLRFGLGAGEQATTQPSDQRTERKAAQRQLRRLEKQYRNAVNAAGDAAGLVESGRGLVQQYPEFGPARRLLGQILLTAGQFEAGYEQISRALELADKARPELQEMAGTMAMQLGRYERALNHFGEASSLRPEITKYRVFKARALVEMQRFDEARHELLTALNQDSSSYLAHGVMAQLYAKQHRLDQARKHIRRAIELLPPEKDDQRYLYVRQRAELLRRANRPNDALSVLADLPAEERFNKPVLSELALNFHLAGQTGRAATLYANALKAKPHSEAVAEGAVEWAIKAGRLEQARDHLEALRRINPRSPKLSTFRDKLDQAAATQP